MGEAVHAGKRKFINATFSAKNGWWNERLKSAHAFVTALKHMCKANILAEEQILQVRPGAIFIRICRSKSYRPDMPVILAQGGVPVHLVEQAVPGETGKAYKDASLSSGTRYRSKDGQCRPGNG
jgi:hypothetical protein